MTKDFERGIKADSVEIAEHLHDRPLRRLRTEDPTQQLLYRIGDLESDYGAMFSFCRIKVSVTKPLNVYFDILNKRTTLPTKQPV